MHPSARPPVFTAGVSLLSLAAGTCLYLLLLGSTSAQAVQHHHGAAASAQTTGTAECSCNRSCGDATCSQCCPGTKAFVVHSDKGSNVIVKVDDTTKFSPKGKSWDDVKADTKVTVTYHKVESEKVAASVHFHTAKKAAKPAAKTGS
jgi:hypothetical protein